MGASIPYLIDDKKITEHKSFASYGVERSRERKKTL